MKLSKLLLIPLLGMLIFVGTASALTLYWNNPNNGYSSLSQQLTVEKKTNDTFWAVQWNWNESDYGGYIGLQGVPNKERVLFSLWNANAAKGKNCGQFGGEGIGYHCWVSIPIIQNHIYKLQVKRLNKDDSTGVWWGGYLDRTFVGAIRVPANNTLINMATIDFTEYYGGQPCNDRNSVAIWSRPIFNNKYIGSFGSYSAAAACNGTGTVNPIIGRHQTLYRAVGD
jgi:hypothetical protein